MESGRKRHLVNVKKRDESATDEYGQPDLSAFIHQFKMRCNVQVLSGTELVKNGVELSTEYISVMANFDRRMQHGFFIEWKGLNYSVQSIKPDDRNRDMVLTAGCEI